MQVREMHTEIQQLLEERNQSQSMIRALQADVRRLKAGQSEELVRLTQQAEALQLKLESANQQVQRP